MEEESISVKLVTEWNINEIADLYKSVGWWNDFDSSKIPILIKGSFAFAVAIDVKTKKAIGMGRILSDGISDAYIQDVVVNPSFRNKGIGYKIVKKLLDYCILNKVEWIALISEPNQRNFYIPLGFKEMKNYTPMKYEM